MEGRKEIMSTDIRADISKSNKYWIDRHRYYELKHFCLQYKVWQKIFLSIDSMTNIPEWIPASKNNTHSDPTLAALEARTYYRERIDMIHKAANLTDQTLGIYILKAVTEGRSYESMKAMYNVPCSRGVFYENYRKFFWLLNQMRK